MALLPRPQNRRECHLCFAEACHLYCGYSVRELHNLLCVKSAVVTAGELNAPLDIRRAGGTLCIRRMSVWEAALCRRLTFLGGWLTRPLKKGFPFWWRVKTLPNPRGPRVSSLLRTSLLAWRLVFLVRFSAGYFEKFDRDTLITDLEGLRDCCDVARIRHYAGGVFLRLIVDGDKLSGRSPLSVDAP